MSLTSEFSTVLSVYIGIPSFADKVQLKDDSDAENVSSAGQLYQADEWENPSYYITDIHYPTWE